MAGRTGSRYPVAEPGMRVGGGGGGRTMDTQTTDGDMRWYSEH